MRKRFFAEIMNYEVEEEQKMAKWFLPKKHEVLIIDDIPPNLELTKINQSGISRK